MTQSDILIKHLSTVFDPELGANIVELGMVKKVDHKESTVKIDLALTIADCPMRNQIEKEITRKLTLLENVEIVEINVVAVVIPEDLIFLDVTSPVVIWSDAVNTTFPVRP